MFLEGIRRSPHLRSRRRVRRHRRRVSRERRAERECGAVARSERETPRVLRELRAQASLDAQRERQRSLASRRERALEPEALLGPERPVHVPLGQSPAPVLDVVRDGPQLRRGDGRQHVPMAGPLERELERLGPLRLRHAQQGARHGRSRVPSSATSPTAGRQCVRRKGGRGEEKPSVPARGQERRGATAVQWMPCMIISFLDCMCGGSAVAAQPPAVARPTRLASAIRPHGSAGRRTSSRTASSPSAS
jgi:hypothetical protein